MFNRRRIVGFALFLALLTVVGVQRSLTSHSVVGVLISLVVFGIPAGFSVSMALRRRPALVIDSRCITEGRSGRTVPWADVETVVVGKQRRLFGVGHHLVIVLAQEGSAPRRRFITSNATNPREIDIDLNWLDRPWADVVAAVEGCSGRRTISRTEGAFGR